MKLIPASSTSLFLIFMCVHLEVNAQTALTLDDCLSKVRAATPDARQMVLTDAQLELQQKINNSQYLPHTSINGKASWQSDVTSFSLDFPGIDIPVPSKDQYAATLDIYQPIYDGGYTSAKKDLQEQEAAASRFGYATGIQTTEDLATNLFFQILLQQQVVTSMDLLISQLQEVQTTAEHQFSQGVVDKQALLEIKVKLQESTQKREEAIADIAKAKNSLSILMGTPDQDFTVDQITTDVYINQDSAFSSRPEIKLLDARTRVVGAADRVNRTQYHPTLSAFACTLSMTISSE